MLVKMGKASQEAVNAINAQFDKVDADGSGTLTLEDINDYASKKKDGASRYTSSKVSNKVSSNKVDSSRAASNDNRASSSKDGTSSGRGGAPSAKVTPILSNSDTAAPTTDGFESKKGAPSVSSPMPATTSIRVEEKVSHSFVTI